MIIFSQNRKIIVECDFIGVCESIKTDGYDISAIERTESIRCAGAYEDDFTECEDIVVGSFTTKEAALKALNAMFLQMKRSGIAEVPEE